MNTNNGGPAFPLDYSEKGFGEQGMTLRDWFAGQALAGILAGKYWEAVTIQNPIDEAYVLADAMIAERSKSCVK